jgi:acyl carrier protein
MMERKEILLRIEAVFRETLDDENIILKDETTADDIEAWDSLTHIQLIVALEKNFKIKFTSKEILSWENIGKMLDCVTSKL